MSKLTGDCSFGLNKTPSDRLPNYPNTLYPVLKIFKMAEDRLHPVRSDNKYATKRNE